MFNTYHAKIQVFMSTRSVINWAIISGFGRPPLQNSNLAGNNWEIWGGREVTSSNQDSKNNLATLVCGKSVQKSLQKPTLPNSNFDPVQPCWSPDFFRLLYAIAFITAMIIADLIWNPQFNIWNISYITSQYSMSKLAGYVLKFWYIVFNLLNVILQSWNLIFLSVLILFVPFIFYCLYCTCNRWVNRFSMIVSFPSSVS